MTTIGRARSGGGRERRGAATDRKIYESALELIRAEGLGAVTVEAVAARSGVARTTIYRRHKDRDAVVSAALNYEVITRAFEPGADVRKDLESVMVSMAAAISERLGAGIFMALLQSQDPRQLELIREKFIRPRITLVADRLRLAIRSGELRPDVNVEAVAEMVVGSVAARFASQGAFPSGWARTRLDMLWPAIVADRKTPG